MRLESPPSTFIIISSTFESRILLIIIMASLAVFTAASCSPAFIAAVALSSDLAKSVVSIPSLSPAWMTFSPSSIVSMTVLLSSLSMSLRMPISSVFTLPKSFSSSRLLVISTLEDMAEVSAPRPAACLTLSSMDDISARNDSNSPTTALISLSHSDVASSALL